jgi:ketosteroid isomerase-like protein
MLRAVSEDNVLKVQALWRSFESEGLEAMLRIADDDAEWIPAQSGGRRYVGHDGLRELVGELRDAGTIDAAKAYSFSDYGNCVLVYGRLGDVSGDDPEAGRVFWIYTFRDGRLIRFEAFDDHAEAVRVARRQGGAG